MPEAQSRSYSKHPELEQTLWGVAWPLLFSLAFSLSLTFVDSFFLSRISDQAAAAAGALLPLLGTTLVVFTAVAQAGANIAAQLVGARRHNELGVVYLVLVGFNLALGLLTSGAFFTLRNVLPGWLGLSGGMRAQASTYLSIIGSFQFLKSTQIAYGNILNSRGKTKWVLSEALITNACNIVLNLCFLRGSFGLPRLGVAGVALATVVSLALGLAFTLIVVHLGFRIRFPRRPERALLLRHARRVLGIGLPSAIEPISYQSAQMVINHLIVSWGVAALAARTYVSNFVMVTTILWGAAFGVGTQVMVARRVGAERFADADAQMKRGLGVAIVGNLVLAALLALSHRFLIRSLTADVRVATLASPLFFLCLLVEPCRAVNIVAGGSLRSSGDARYTAITGTLLMWGFGVPACYFFGGWLGWGLPGIWLGLGLDELTRGIVNYRRWRTGRWQDFRVSVRPAAS